MTPYKDFTTRLKLLISKNPQLIKTTLSNIFTTREIGTKTHGDLAEIAINEFINQYMDDFLSEHTGKKSSRKKNGEEDIKVISEITRAEFVVSLKAYSHPDIQLSTDKKSLMFSRLKQEITPLQEESNVVISDTKRIKAIFDDEAFNAFKELNVLLLVHDGKNSKSNILTFDFDTARDLTGQIRYETRTKHKVFKFCDAEGDYICEVRYGSGTANAFQRGLWTYRKDALKRFESVIGGWIDHVDNPLIVTLFSHALLSTSQGHAEALERLKADVEAQKRGANIP